MQSVDRVGALTRVLKGKRFKGRVLLVDDICGSGATLRRVQHDLATLLSPNAQLLTARHRRPGPRPAPARAPRTHPQRHLTHVLAARRLRLDCPGVGFPCPDAHLRSAVLAEQDSIVDELQEVFDE